MSFLTSEARNPNTTLSAHSRTDVLNDGHVVFATIVPKCTSGEFLGKNDGASVHQCQTDAQIVSLTVENSI